MEKNKTGKYLKYAIGEIILVVIGILIALWINNWNNQRTVDYQTTNLLKNIKKDLVSDTLAFDKKIKNCTDLIAEKKKLMSISDFESIELDSLINIISSVQFLYDINNTTFTTVTNLGITKLSENDSLSNKIQSYYTKELKSFSEFITWEKENTTYEANYWFGQNELELGVEFPRFQDSITARKNFIKIITEPKGRNQLLKDYYRKQRVLVKYQEMKKIASELINEIQIDLN